MQLHWTVQINGPGLDPILYTIVVIVTVTSTAIRVTTTTYNGQIYVCDHASCMHSHACVSGLMLSKDIVINFKTLHCIKHWSWELMSTHGERETGYLASMI